MSNYKSNDQNPDDDIASEYDFSHGVRGKHYKAMSSGYTIVVHKNDGSTEVREVAPRPETVVLAPDVRLYFPDAESVNRALCGLISLLPQHTSPSEKE